MSISSLRSQISNARMKINKLEEEIDGLNEFKRACDKKVDEFQVKVESKLAIADDVKSLDRRTPMAKNVSKKLKKVVGSQFQGSVLEQFSEIASQIAEAKRQIMKEISDLEADIEGWNREIARLEEEERRRAEEERKKTEGQKE